MEHLFYRYPFDAFHKVSIHEIGPGSKLRQDRDSPNGLCGAIPIEEVTPVRDGFMVTSRVVPGMYTASSKQNDIYVRWDGATPHITLTQYYPPDFVVFVLIKEHEQSVMKASDE